MIVEKICSRCSEPQPELNFYKNSKCRGGRATICKSCYAEYYTDNKDREKVRMKIWRDKNTKRRSEYNTSWRKSNPDKHNSAQAKRRARKLSATPHWLSSEQQKEIDFLYWLARDLRATSGEKYEVDHIIPLKSPVICGLHVPWNLQILPESVNRVKQNNFEGDNYV